MCLCWYLSGCLRVLCVLCVFLSGVFTKFKPEYVLVFSPSNSGKSRLHVAAGRHGEFGVRALRKLSVRRLPNALAN